jgi:guanylate kinase
MSLEGVRTCGSGLVFVLAAPSGAGKTTLVRRLLESLGGLRFSVSCTTRERRPGEVDGVDYRFLDEGRFRDMAAAGQFLERAEVHGRLYGTLRAEIEGILAAGSDALLDVDVQGAEAVRRTLPEAVLTFLLPPDFGVLRRRLVGRGTAEAEIARRLTVARQELDRARGFDYLVINDRLDEALVVLEAIILAERSRRARRWAAWEAVAATFPIGGDHGGVGGAAP